MEEYLKEIHGHLPGLHDSDKTGVVWVVLGNEAADLDSTACALVYAYFLHKSGKLKGSTVKAPVIKVSGGPVLSAARSKPTSAAISERNRTPTRPDALESGVIGSSGGLESSRMRSGYDRFDQDTTTQSSSTRQPASMDAGGRSTMYRTDTPYPGPQVEAGSSLSIHAREQGSSASLFQVDSATAQGTSSMPNPIGPANVKPSVQMAGEVSKQVDLIVPVLNMRRDDFVLKTEVAHAVINMAKLPSAMLIFKDDVNFMRLAGQGRLKLTLVDHNYPGGQDAIFADCVAEIIDHHQKDPNKEAFYAKTELTWEMCGSCSTLVADKVLNSKQPDIMDKTCANLLFGAIVLDTVNLSESAGRTTDHDKKMVELLTKKFFPYGVHQDETFKALQDAKNDVGDMAYKDILRRDMKVVSIETPPVKVAVCSIPYKALKFLENSATLYAVRCFGEDNKYDVIVLMGAEVTTPEVAKPGVEATIVRDMVVFSAFRTALQEQSTVLSLQLTAALKSFNQPSLELQEVELASWLLGGDYYVSAFEQHNAKASRKVVLPVVKEWLESSYGVPSAEGEYSHMEPTIAPGAKGPVTFADRSPSYESSRSDVHYPSTMPDGINEPGPSGYVEDPDLARPDYYQTSRGIPEDEEEVDSVFEEAVGAPVARSTPVLNDTHQRRKIGVDPAVFDEVSTNSPSGFNASVISNCVPTLHKLKCHNITDIRDLSGYDAVYCNGLDDRKSVDSLGSNVSEAGSNPNMLDDMATPDGLDTGDELDEDNRKLTAVSPPVPEMSATEERDLERSWKTVVIGMVTRKLDLKVINPYRGLITHGGYQGNNTAIVVFSACHLPDKNRKDYDYVMDNLFLYVMSTLQELVVDDYVIVYFHGGGGKSSVPAFSWLKKSYEMIDHRLRKHLKALFIVHPSFFVKTMVMMIKPFVSSKFGKKIRFMQTLSDLEFEVNMDQVNVPDQVKQADLEVIAAKSKKTIANWLNQTIL